MEIVLGKNYTLTCDDKQFILVENIKKTESRYYFTTLSGVCKFFIKKKIRINNNINSLSDMENKIEKESKLLEKKFKEYIKVNKNDL